MTELSALAYSGVNLTHKTGGDSLTTPGHGYDYIILLSPTGAEQELNMLRGDCVLFSYL